MNSSEASTIVHGWQHAERTEGADGHGWYVFETEYMDEGYIGFATSPGEALELMKQNEIDSGVAARPL